MLIIRPMRMSVIQFGMRMLMRVRTSDSLVAPRQLMQNLAAMHMHMSNAQVGMSGFVFFTGDEPGTRCHEY